MTEKRKTKRQLQAKATRKKIYNTAMELIAEKGYENITVEEICKNAGVAKGSFYYYFKSKNDFIAETYKTIDEDYETLVSSDFKDITTCEKILKTVLFQAGVAVEKGLAQTIAIYQSQLVTGTEYFISEDRYFFKTMSKFISEGQKNGEITSQIKTEEIVRTILSIARGQVYDWCLHEGRYDIMEIMKTRFELIIKAFIP